MEPDPADPVLPAAPLPSTRPLQIIKRTGVQMQQRSLPQATVDKWQHTMERLEPQVC